LTQSDQIREQRYFKRLLLADRDFRRAEEFVQEMLKRRLFENLTVQREVEAYAFQTALIVSYCRPFSDNKSGAKRDVLPRISDKVFLSDLETPEKETHSLLIDLRNQIYAHSDPDAFEVQVKRGQASWVGEINVPYWVFTEEQLDLVLSIIQKHRQLGFLERSRLLEKIEPGMSF
jgi:hypothetical protein